MNRAAAACLNSIRTATDWGSRLLVALTLGSALLWVFPLYWAVVTSLKPDEEVIGLHQHLVPYHPTLGAYVTAIERSSILRWYLNSGCTSFIITLVALAISLVCAYALSQIAFPGRTVIYGMLVASIMVPTEALVINHFVLMNRIGLIDSWGGIILPQLVVPSSVIIFKRHFDRMPRDYREAAMLDNAGHWRTFSKIYIPMNQGVIVAVGIITFVASWNNFLWPFLMSTSDSTTTIPVGITQIRDFYGIRFAENMALAVLAGLPLAILYILFQKWIVDSCVSNFSAIR